MSFFRNLRTLLTLLILSPALGFASGGFLGDQGTSRGPSEETLEKCFLFPDPGMRSGCLIDISVKEKDVLNCDLIEIPGMVHDCIDQVAAVTAITDDKCKIMNEKFRDHCRRAIRR